MGTLHVRTEDLSATANSLDGRVQTLDGIRSEVFAAAVPAGAFGRIPGLGSHLDQVYTDHVTQSQEVLQEAKDGLGNAVQSLRATASGFDQLEQQTSEHLTSCVPD